MRTTLYQITDDAGDSNGGAYFVATLAEARAYRKGLDYPNGAVTKIITADLPLRALCVAIANQVGFADEQIDVLPSVGDRESSRARAVARIEAGDIDG